MREAFDLGELASGPGSNWLRITQMFLLMAVRDNADQLLFDSEDGCRTVTMYYRTGGVQYELVSPPAIGVRKISRLLSERLRFHTRSESYSFGVLEITICGWEMDFLVVTQEWEDVVRLRVHLSPPPWGPRLPPAIMDRCRQEGTHDVDIEFSAEELADD